jgi:hypothetical protein
MRAEELVEQVADEDCGDLAVRVCLTLPGLFGYQENAVLTRVFNCHGSFL